MFAPVGELVPVALRAVAPGGTVVCAGIHMSDIPSFPYADLWGERTLRSVANLTREDGEEFMRLAPEAGIRAATERIRSPARPPRSSASARVGSAAPPYSRSNRGTDMADVTVKRTEDFETYFLGAMAKVRSASG